MNGSEMNRIIKEYDGLSKKVDNLSKSRNADGAEQMLKASSEMDGMKKALLCMGYDIGKEKSGKYSIRRLMVMRK